MSGRDGQFVRVLDAFQGGPNLVRGFAPAGFGPRDLTPGHRTTMRSGWNAVLGDIARDSRRRCSLAPKDFRYAARDSMSMPACCGASTRRRSGLTGENMTVADSTRIRSSVGVGLLWVRHSVRCALTWLMR